MSAQGLTAEAFTLGEGGRWVDGRFVFVDILAGRLLELIGSSIGQGARVAGGAVRELARLEVPLGAVAPTTGGPEEWVVAAGTGIALLDGAGRLTWLARPEDASGGATRMNDGVADPAGRFWAGSMAYDGTSPRGSLYRADADGSVHQVWEGLPVVNGPAFTRDGRVMYLDDTARGVVLRFSVSTEGVLSEPTEHWRAGDGDGHPDGATVDDDDHLWVAMWGGGEVVRIDPQGQVAARIPLPARQPTSVCLAEGQVLVTSATQNLSDPAPGDGRLYAVPLSDLGLTVEAPAARPYRRS